jgi:hypothetical protein
MAQPQGGGPRSAWAVARMSLVLGENLDSTREDQGSLKKNSCKINAPVFRYSGLRYENRSGNLLRKS